MKQNIVVPLLAFALLTACGGSGSSNSSEEVDAKEATTTKEVTSDNIVQAISVEGASSTDVSNQQLPETLKTIDTSSVESIVVSANSNFNFELSVPAEDVPLGKKVAGYLIEIIDGEYSFIPVASNIVSASSKSISSNDVPKTKKSQRSLQFKRSPVDKSISILAAAPESVGSTSINFEGWGNSEFTLSESLADLKIRIYPLLVNDSITDIQSISDIDLTDESNWVGMQELSLKVEAVATAPIQVSLTWDSITDIDLWIVEPDGGKIYYANYLSSKSLGWLDYDNTEAYGPENITFNYQMPQGDYNVYVHHYDGGVKTNYQVTIAMGDEVTKYSGDFPEGVVASDDEETSITDAAVNFVGTISIDSVQNNKLMPKIAASQYQGTWKLPESSSVGGYVVIDGEVVTAYVMIGEECFGDSIFNGAYLPTGFSTNGEGLQIKEALVGALNFTDESSSLSYTVIDLQLSELPGNCTLYDYGDEESEVSEGAEDPVITE